ncbi:MAG: 30S ribosome-binding factor RbfA [Clostridiales Family XIII bacterium]|jgi:ribosome-binding factor A|nr:30S ribosome-binding factor RbfA [Clostridiales Family XIII bacterium]
MHNFSKDRVTEDAKRIINSIIKEDLSDPLFDNFITIKDIKIPRGKGLFTIYFNAGFDNSDEVLELEKRIKAAFEKSTPFIRGKIARVLKLRKAPELRFEIDNAMRNAEKIEKLLNE